MSRLTPNQRALVRTEKLGFVFQSFNLLPRTTALHNVIMPLDYSPHRPGLAKPGGWPKALLDRVGLADRADHEPSQMSGGQQQRVAIARSLVNRPSLVLADEPTGNLDSHTSVEILRMFQQLNAEGITVILVTHDPKVAAYAHRTIHIADGQIANDDVAAPRQRQTVVPDIERNGHEPGNGSRRSVVPPDRRSERRQPVHGSQSMTSVPVLALNHDDDENGPKVVLTPCADSRASLRLRCRSGGRPLRGPTFP